MKQDDPLENGQQEEDDDNEDTPLVPTPSMIPSIPRQYLFYGLACACLACQNSSYTLIRRFGHGVLKEEASSQSILAVGEMMKGVFCIYMVLRDHRRRTAANLKGEEMEDGQEAREDPANATSVLKRLASTSAPMAVPAIIFLAMNLLSFVSLRRISASAFTLIQQSKLIATAVLSRIILDKRLSEVRWRALGTLLFAVLIICYETKPLPSSKVECAVSGATMVEQRDEEAETIAAASRAADYAVGVTAVSLEAALSGFSNVYFERVLKSTSLTLWERNVQLAGYSLLIYVPMALSVHPYLLHGWSILTWLTAFLGALGGILIGLVINYMDSISKNLALSVAIVLTAVLDHWLFAGPMNLPIVASAGIVITSIASYSAG